MSRHDDLKKLITDYERRLQKLKEQKASYGLATEPHILIEIEDIEVQIAELQEELVILEKIDRLNPYRGLSVFREEDEPFFFGREIFVTQLVESVQQKRLVAVLGPSGSGKSSIVFAGLLPCLRRDGRWLIVTFRPGQNPFRALAAALLPFLSPTLSEVDQLVERRKMSEALNQRTLDLSEVVVRILEKNAPVERLLLVADQFEELYTLCSEPQIRQAFLDMLLPAVVLASSNPPPPAALHLVLTLRADFLTQTLTYRPFADALREADVKLGPMTPAELRRAIEQPAEAQRVSFEPGLVDRILADIKDEPGNLPLLEFALTALWEQQSRGKLTHTAYDAIGQVEGALSRHAEQVFAGLSEAEQAQARRVFVQMVRPGEGTEDTRRLAHRDELNEADWLLVQQMASARLVVTDRDPAEQETVEVVHEALIQGWDRLTRWMNEDRRFRAWQERLRVAQRQWETSQQDEGALLRGAPLAEAEDWLAERETDLSVAEQAFIQTSITLQDKEQAEEEARSQRELEQAQRLAEEQRQRVEEQQEAITKQRKLIWLAIGVGVIAVIAAIFAGWFGIRETQSANTAATAQVEAEAEAIKALNAQATADAERAEAERQAAIALSRQLAAQAIGLIERRGDLELSLLLALEATQIPSNTGLAPISEANDALRQALALSPLVVLRHETAVWVVSFSPDGTRLATASDDGTAHLWDTASGEEVAVLRHETVVWAVSFSPDGTQLATTSLGGPPRLWDTASGEEVAVLRHETAAWAATFNPDGTRLATASAHGTARLWDTASGEEVAILRHEAGVNVVTFSSDGTQLATAGAYGTAHLWDTASGEEVAILRHEAGVNVVTFSPDGTQLATASLDGTARLWETASGKEVAVLRHEAAVRAVTFSPDGTQLATASLDGTARLWQVKENSLIELACGILSRNMSDQEWTEFLGDRPYRKTCPRLPPGGG